MANFVGTSGNDYIIGTEQGDTIDAGGGDDEAYGNGGNDTIRGEDGAGSWIIRLEDKQRRIVPQDRTAGGAA